MMVLLLELPLQLDNTPLSLALHAAVATIVSIATVVTVTTNPPWNP
jgi:hypothetical protein